MYDPKEVYCLNPIGPIQSLALNIILTVLKPSGHSFDLKNDWDGTVLWGMQRTHET